GPAAPPLLAIETTLANQSAPASVMMSTCPPAVPLPPASPSSPSPPFSHAPPFVPSRPGRPALPSTPEASTRIAPGLIALGSRIATSVARPSDSNAAMITESANGVARELMRTYDRAATDRGACHVIVPHPYFGATVVSARTVESPAIDADR